MDIICYACGRGENPENSLEAIGHCQKVNPQWRVEMDLQLTSDGEIVLFHDSNTLRVTGEDHLISDLSLEEARRLDIGFHFKNGDSDITYMMPTLHEVLLCYPGMKYLLDVHTADTSIVPQLIEQLEKYLKPDQFIVVSEYDHIIKAVKEERPEWTYGAATNEAKKLVYSSFLRADSLFPLQSDLLMIPEYHHNTKVLTNRIIQHVKNRGKQLWVWKKEGDTVENIESIDDFNRYASMGVDAVFVDKPEKITALILSIK